MNELNLKSIDVASYVLKWCIHYNYYVNMTKLQKILYCVYGVLLAEMDVRICNEHPKAKEYGPVFEQVSNYIVNQLGIIEKLLNQKNDIQSVLTDEQKELIGDIVKGFGVYNTSQLIRWTKRIDSPWWIATKQGTKLNIVIPDDLLKTYFKGVMVVKDAEKCR